MAHTPGLEAPVTRHVPPQMRTQCPNPDNLSGTTAQYNGRVYTLKPHQRLPIFLGSPADIAELGELWRRAAG